MKKSFASLKQHNKSLWMLKKITQMHQSLKEDVIMQFLTSRYLIKILSLSMPFQMLTFKSIQGRKIDLMSEKQKFMAERLQQLEQSGQRLLNQKLNEAMSSYAIFSKIYRTISQMYSILQQNGAKNSWHQWSAVPEIRPAWAHCRSIDQRCQCNGQIHLYS